MNLDSVPSEEKLKTCKRYFIIGCFGLPFVWLINGIWFLREAFFVKSEVTTTYQALCAGITPGSSYLDSFILSCGHRYIRRKEGTGGNQGFTYHLCYQAVYLNNY